MTIVPAIPNRQVAYNLEMTVEEAADFLNVSRTYLLSLLDRGELSYREKDGTRFLNRQAVIQYDDFIHTERMKALDELSALDQELGLDC